MLTHFRGIDVPNETVQKLENRKSDSGISFDAIPCVEYDPTNTEITSSGLTDTGMRREISTGSAALFRRALWRPRTIKQSSLNQS